MEGRRKERRKERRCKEGRNKKYKDVFFGTLSSHDFLYFDFSYASNSFKWSLLFREINLIILP